MSWGPRKRNKELHDRVRLRGYVQHKHRERERHTERQRERERKREKEREIETEREKRRQERVCSVAVDPDNLENNKEAGGKHKIPRN